MAPPRRRRRVLSETTLTVWHYDSPMGAAAGEIRLTNLQKEGAVTVIDAITLTWMRGAHRPRVGRLRRHAGIAGATGLVLGGLADLLVGAPDATEGAVEQLAGIGIDAHFLVDVRERLLPGSSALLVLSRDADLDVVRVIIERGQARGDVTLAHAVLRDDATETLRALSTEVSGP
jgi:uncharacterized membrane protein